ncbi:MAG: hypothetical protein N2235_05310 [Fischerella sp.]|nr:hypothetical protein [Fischerella sp.]
MKWLLRFLEKIDRKRTILDRESSEPYLNRYYLFLKNRKRFPFNIFLHQFLKSDPDCLHDHPWPYATFILKGGYWEWVPTINQQKNIIVGEHRIWRGAGHFRICNAKSLHRIELEPGVDCWTLFIPGPQQREWGFMTHKNWEFDTFQWVPHEKYIQDKMHSMR